MTATPPTIRRINKGISPVKLLLDAPNFFAATRLTTIPVPVHSRSLEFKDATDLTGRKDY
jgi:hypothetical protein